MDSFSRSAAPSSLLATALLALLAACSGDIGDAALPWRSGSSGAPESGPGEPRQPGEPGGMAGTDREPTGPTGSNSEPDTHCEDSRIGARVVPLTARQYVNVLRDVLGASAVSDADAATSGELVFEVVDLPRVTTATLDRLMRLSDGAVASVRPRAADFFGCASLMDDACVRTKLGQLGRRIYKRPLEPAELDALMETRASALSAAADDQGATATLTALQALLIAPSALYRTEFAAGPASHELTVHERAAALAAFLLDSLPDAQLLAAADDGSLMAADGLAREIDRLLALPRVRTHLSQLVLNAYKVPRVFETPKDNAKFPEYTAALQNSMYEETRRFVDDVLWTRGAALGELLTSRRSFVDAALARLYGVAAPRGGSFTPVDLPPERAGLLTQASVLSVLSRTDVNSVVARGLFVRGNLLCLPKIPGPPASVQAQVSMQLDSKASQRELAMYRATTSPCLSCHQQFDRFGLLLEAYDPIGRFRPDQAAAVDFSGLSPLSGSFSNIGELTGRFEQDAMFERCFSDRTLSYALSIANDSQQLCLQGKSAPALAGATIRDLVLAIADSPAFNSRSAEP